MRSNHHTEYFLQRTLLKSGVKVVLAGVVDVRDGGEGGGGRLADLGGF